MDNDALFRENLRIFEKFCPRDAGRVKDADCEGYEYCSASNGLPNIKKITNEGTFFFHSQIDPKREAEAQLSGIEQIDTLDGIVVFGVGLGYFYDACKEWLAKKEERLLFFIEPDPALLRVFFKSERSKEILADPQVAVLSAFPDRYNGNKIQLHNLEIPIFCLWDSRFQFSLSSSYVGIYEEFWSLLKKIFLVEIRNIQRECFFYLPEVVGSEIENISHNYWKLASCQQFYGMENCMQGIPAVICGAGPSLVDDLPHLKEEMNRFFLMGAGSGMNALNKSHFTAHFGVGIDPHDVSASRILSNYAYEVPYAFQTRFHYQALDLLHGPLLFFRGADGYGLQTWIEKQLGIDKFPRVETSASTTHACLVVALLLGCDPIILLGVDLAYTDKKRYSEGVKAHPLDRSSDHQIIKEIDPSAFLAKGKEGSQVITKGEWVAEASAYGMIAERYPHSTLINCTSRGLDIPGLNSLTFDQAAAAHFGPGYDLENMIHANIQLQPEMAIPKEKIGNVFKRWRESLSRCAGILSDLLKELERIAGRLDQDINYPTEEQEKLMKSLQEEEAYFSFLKDFSNKYKSFFYNKYFRIRFRDETLSPTERIARTIECETGRLIFLLKYLSSTETDMTLALQEEAGKTIAEPTDRVVRKPDEEGYSFDGSRMTINDEEIGFSHQEDFHPLKIEDSKNVQERFGLKFASLEEGIAEGQCLSLDPAGWVRGEWYYKQGKLHGPAAFYSPEGKILSRGWFLEGKKEGKNWQYYLSGQLYSLKRYRQGELHGKQEYYYEHGAPKTLLFYDRGKLDGKVQLYYPNGQIKREIHFQNGNMHGVERMWDQKGQLILESDYENNRPSGYSRSWYSNGQIQKEVIYYDTPEQFAATVWNKEGEVIEKQVILPENIRKEALNMESQARSRIAQIKEKLQRLKEGK